MKTILNRYVIALVAASLLGGCGLVRDRSGDYIDAEKGKELRVPDWYENHRIHSKYPIPDAQRNEPLDRDFQMPRPPELAVSALDVFYEIQSVEEQEWLLVNMAPGRVWPSLDKFWENAGISVAHENPSLGLMQTGRLGLSAKSRQLAGELGLSVDDGYFVIQSKLGQGVKRHTSELQLRVLKLENDAEKRFEPWQSLSNNATQELQLLTKIGDFLEDNQSRPGYSLLANDIGGSSRVSLVAPKGEIPYIRIDLSFERSWSSAEKALKKSDITIVDKDRSQGTYYVWLKLKEDTIFTWLFAKDGQQLEPNVLVRLVQDAKGAVRLTVEGIDGDLDPERVRSLLNQLLESIS